MLILLIILMPIVAILAAIIVVSMIASVVAVAHRLLPGPKVPLRYTVRNLQTRLVTTAVTGVAFVLVIGLVTGMLAFLRGMERLTETSGRPGNVIILSDGALDETFSNMPNASVEELPSDMQKAVEKGTDGKYLVSREVYIVAVYTIPAPDGGLPTRRFVQMRGLDDIRMAATIHGLELEKGEWLSASGAREVNVTKDGRTYPTTFKEVVLGNGIARTFGADVGKSTLEPGDTVQIGPVSWYVVGVMKENNSSYGSEIWAVDTHVQSTFGRGLGSYSSLVGKTKSEEIGSKAAKALSESQSGARSYNAFTEKEYFSKLGEASMMFRGVMNVIALALALGGALGVMVTMFAAISQRTKDIGVLRLLGFKRFQILCSFQVESLVIAAIGGALGVLAAYLIVNGWTANSIIGGQGGGGKSVVLRMTVDMSVIISAALLTFLMGAVGGFIPSVSAMRLKPLESLR